MSLTRLLALTLGLSLVMPSLADARKKKADEEESADEDEDEEKGKDKDKGDEEASDEDEGDGGSTTAEDEDEEEATPKKKKGEQSSEEEPAKEFVKQNLSGHDMGTTKKENEFEKDRFYVDKIDTDKTEKGTLVQGSITSTSFLYTESGGTYAKTDPAGQELGPNSSRFSRMFTELRLQTDFRHIGAGRWDARVDLRARVINQPDQTTTNTTSPTGGTFSADPNHVQSGFNGTNEYDLRELWIFRSGKRSDIFFGRQFIADLAGVKFDGLRIDYAKSQKFTLIGFGGLYPLRGSRSITTDYTELETQTVDGSYASAGRFVAAGGFGTAYRTVSAYGALGGVVLYPLAGEQPRVFATSTGYFRSGSTLDFYHFALIDLYSSQVNAGVTNLSLGANFKPSPRLRITGAVNRVDIDTLAVQANAFLNDPSVGGTNVENETFFRRLATNTARVGVSAGLGQFQRFEISLSAAYRQRPGITVPVVGGGPGVPLQGTKGVEVAGSILDRRSFKDLRLGLDVTRTIGIGSADTIAFMRSNIFAMRVYAARELANGHGEWEAEVTYSDATDSANGTNCGPGATNVVLCYGSSEGTIISAGGNLYYRINRDWMASGTLFVTRQTLNYLGNDMVAAGTRADPAVLGLTGFGRISYRF